MSDENNIAIKVENLTKIYYLYDAPLNRLKESLHPLRKKYHHDFYALNDVSFEIKKGETVGIIGKNGSGKSTLLKILTEVLTPTRGCVDVIGRVSALLELGSGFNPEFTGLENVYFQGSIMGFSKMEMEDKLEEILAFADIGEFINQPVKTYSSGMYVRLAFAAAVNVDPDILIVDEALSVGDMRFQQKCFRKMRSFMESGKTVIFVTHDTGAVISFCERSIWLKDGKIHKIGQSDDVVKKYISYMAYDLETADKKQIKNIEMEKENNEIKTLNSEFNFQNQNDPNMFYNSIDWFDVCNCENFGDGGVKITHVAFINNKTGEKTDVLEGGENVSFYVKLEVYKVIENPGIGLRLTDRHGNHIFSISSYVDGTDFGKFEKGIRYIEITFDFPLLMNGDYCFTTALSNGSQLNHIQEHWIDDAYILKVSNKSLRHALGILALPAAEIIKSVELK